MADTACRWCQGAGCLVCGETIWKPPPPVYHFDPDKIAGDILDDIEADPAHCPPGYEWPADPVEALEWHATEHHRKDAEGKPNVRPDVCRACRDLVMAVTQRQVREMRRRATSAREG